MEPRTGRRRGRGGRRSGAGRNWGRCGQLPLPSSSLPPLPSPLPPCPSPPLPPSSPLPSSLLPFPPLPSLSPAPLPSVLPSPSPPLPLPSPPLTAPAPLPSVLTSPLCPHLPLPSPLSSPSPPPPPLPSPSPPPPSSLVPGALVSRPDSDGLGGRYTCDWDASGNSGHHDWFTWTDHRGREDPRVSPRVGGLVLTSEESTRDPHLRRPFPTPIPERGSETIPSRVPLEYESHSPNGSVILGDLGSHTRPSQTPPTSVGRSFRRVPFPPPVSPALRSSPRSRYPTPYPLSVRISRNFGGFPGPESIRLGSSPDTVPVPDLPPGSRRLSGRPSGHGVEPCFLRLDTEDLCLPCHKGTPVHAPPPEGGRPSVHRTLPRETSTTTLWFPGDAESRRAGHSTGR